MSNTRMLLVDVSNLVYRQHHAMFKQGLTDCHGQPTGALFGSVRALMNLRRAWPAEYGACLLDGGSTRRRALFPDYKGTRTAMPPGLKEQMDQFKEWSAVLGWPTFRVGGEEADDLIGYLATTAKPACINDVMMVSGDKDFRQLLGPGITQLMWEKGGFQSFIAADMAKEYGVSPAQFVDFLAMVGDVSDNIPGVEGVGPVSAAGLLTAYGSLQGILVADAGSDRRAAKVQAQRDMALLSQRLAQLIMELPGMDIGPDRLRLQSVDKYAALRLAAKYNFASLVEKFEKLPSNTVSL